MIAQQVIAFLLCNFSYDDCAS